MYRCNIYNIDVTVNEYLQTDPISSIILFRQSMERKPQQQTLSIRISDTLREFLERAKQVISNARGDSVSTSDVAKILLESARDNLLDFRLEVAQLQRVPTQTLATIRLKQRAGVDLSRAEWVFLSLYVQIACENPPEHDARPEAAEYVPLMEALLAVRSLRADKNIDLDWYYLGNLEVPETSFDEEKHDPNLVPQVVARIIQQLKESPTPRKPVFAGRNFYVALRDEELKNVPALNRALQPFLTPLFRLAARGHWIREQQPARIHRPGIAPISDPHIPVAVAGDFRLSADVSPDGDLYLALDLGKRDVMYPISSYPQIREFATMLKELQPGQFWNSTNFAGAAMARREQPVRFSFHRRRDGVRVGFDEAEWHCLQELFATVLSDPALQSVIDELTMVYGEL